MQFATYVAAEVTVAAKKINFATRQRLPLTTVRVLHGPAASSIAALGKHSDYRVICRHFWALSSSGSELAKFCI